MAQTADEHGALAPTEVEDTLRQIRNRIVNSSLMAVCVFALPAVVAVFARSGDIGWHHENFLYAGAYLTLAAITICRGRLPFRMRTYILLGMWFAVGITSLSMWGIAGNGIPFLITGCIFTTVLLGLPHGIAAVTATVAVMAGVWLTGNHSAASRQADLVVYLSSNATWGVRITASCLLMAIIIASLGKLHHAMAATATELRSRSVDLALVNQRLEEEIQDRRRIQQSLLESDARHRALFEFANDGILLLEEQTIVDCNRTVQAMFGVPRDQIIGATPFDFSPRLQPDGCLSEEKGQRYIACVQEGKTQVFEWTHARMDGDPVEVELSLSRLGIGVKTYSLAIMRDISKRKQAEQSLKISEERFRSLHDNIPVGVSRTTPEGSFMSVNPALAALNGYASPDEMMGITAYDIYADAEARRRIVEDLANLGTVKEREVEFRRKDGSSFWGSVTAQKVSEDGGRFSYIDSIVQDITERRQMASALKAAHDDLEIRVAERTKELSAANTRLATSQEELKSMNNELESAIHRANQMAADAEIRSYELEIEMEKRRRTESALRESELKYRSIIENIADGYCEIDPDGNFVFFNDSLCEVMGYPRNELKQMNNAAVLFEKDFERVFKDLASVYESGIPLTGYRYRILRKDGQLRQIETSVSPIHSEKGEILGLRGIVRDIEDRKKYEDQLIYLAYHDPLTELYNRKAFYERLQEAAAAADRYGKVFSLVYIDIDNFKQANDTLGHEIGDGILKMVADRLRNCLRDTDIVARLGGDEFAIILKNPDAGRPDVAARRIVEALSAPYIVAENAIDFISASVGISRYPADTCDPGQLVICADAAMYAAKKERNRHMHYHAIYNAAIS